jgi:hypothetical protein
MGSGGPQISARGEPRSLAGRYPRPAFFLESLRIMVTEVKTGMRVVGCGCKSSFCNDCMKGRGWVIRQRLLLAVTRWRTARPVMLTFTLDPKNFRDAEHGQHYVKKNRCIGKLMQTLRRKVGVGHYFCVLEWQENGFPHWHILVDAPYVPYMLFHDAWQALGPNREGSTKPMGICWVSRGPGGREGSFVDAQHAAMYATKYLIKPPRHGYPEWLMATEDSFFKRYQGSRGLWTDEEINAWIDAAAVEKHWTDAGYPPEWDGLDEEPKEKQTYERSARSIRGRVSKCGSRCVVMAWSEETRGDGEIVNRRRYKLSLPMAINEIRQILNRADEGKRLELTRHEVETLREIATGEKSRAYYDRILWDHRPPTQRALFDKSPHALYGVDF